jgi:soluble epoxide hydrolase/lipid-phosphate phosphatase
MLRLAIPYVPPTPQYTPVEEVARKYPSYGYHVYFASEASATEIEANVCIFFIYFYFTSLTQVLEARLLSPTIIQIA